MDNDIIFAIVASVFGSTGFWALLTAIWNAHNKKVSIEGRMLRGLAHDRICELGEKFLKQGYITRDEYENLHDYLYLPYKELGGNGTAEKIVNDCKKLKLKNEETGKVYYKEMS
jgi:hypothetical protein